MKLSPYLFSLRQLQYAIAVADSLSFNKAADECHVSQPSLSEQMGELERVLCVKLFERDRRQVLVTAAGRDLVERARAILRAADDLVENARRCSDPLAGTLRIGVIPTISPYLLPHLTPVIRSVYPNLTVRWIEDKTNALVRNLNAGTLDAALVALEAEIGDVEREVIATDPFVLVATKGNSLARKTAPAKPSELRGANVLLLDDEHCFGRQALALCSTVNARDLEFRATSLSTIAHMVLGGAGVTLLPELAVSTEARFPGLCVRSFVEPKPCRTIGLVWRRTSTLTTALRHLAATVRRAYPCAPSGQARAMNSGREQRKMVTGARIMR